MFETELCEQNTPEIRVHTWTPEIHLQSIEFANPTASTIRLHLPAVKVTTMSFRQVEIRPTAEKKERPARPPARRLQLGPKRPPPAELPLQERIRSLLQPPISALLGDAKLWLPFEPFTYQFEGIQFLFSRWSAMLGDEMGLGKTMQTILAMRLLLRAGLVRTVLLVCPKPLMTNWVREFTLWAEEIPVAAVQGGTQSRRNFWLHDPSPVKMTNYEALTRDEDLFREAHVSFDLMVLDEAQRIKNRDSHTARAAHGIRRQRSWALTGTPVENRARDLVSLLEFVCNGPAVVEETPAALRSAVGAVLLRRTKEMVLTDMPPKLVHDTFIDLGPSQRQRYDAAERDGVRQLQGMQETVTIEHVFELIRWLKNICNFDPVTGESAKAEKLKADLEEISESGKKAILFSQYVTTLEKLAEVLGDFHPLLYHGGVPAKHRDGVIKTFSEQAERPVILMSYGTGAVGLNLQFANYVFLYDRWWNPAVEDQAINRAHRIGQKDAVSVFRFITPGTIEERIAQVLARKRDLFASLLDDLAPADQALSRDDVFGLFDLSFHAKAA